MALENRRSTGRDASSAYPRAVLASGWFALFTHPRYEKKVAEYLTRRTVESYLPTYKVKRVWKNRQTVSVEFPLFPGYLFARFSADQRAVVLDTPGVLSIVGNRRSADIPERDIELLRTGLKLGRILPHAHSDVGDRVRIVAGPLAGVEGVLTQLRAEWRVVFTIALIRQSVSIEVSRDEIEAASPFDSAGRQE